MCLHERQEALFQYHLFLVTLKEETDEQIVSLFCKGVIGFGQVVLRTLPWIQDKKECIDVLHCKGLVWNTVSTDDQSLNAEEIEGFLRDAYPDALDFKLLSVKRAHVKLSSTPKEPPAALSVAWECTGCFGLWEVWSCCCQLPLSKDCMLEVWGSSSNTSLQGKKGSPPG